MMYFERDNEEDDDKNPSFNIERALREL